MSAAVESGRRTQLLYDVGRVLTWATVMAERLKIATDTAQGRQGRPWDFTDPGFDYDRWKAWMGSWRNWLPSIRPRALKEMRVTSASRRHRRRRATKRNALRSKSESPASTRHGMTTPVLSRSVTPNGPTWSQRPRRWASHDTGHHC